MSINVLPDIQERFHSEQKQARFSLVYYQNVSKVQCSKHFLTIGKVCIFYIYFVLLHITLWVICLVMKTISSLLDDNQTTYLIYLDNWYGKDQSNIQIISITFLFTLIYILIRFAFFTLSLIPNYSFEMGSY